MGAMGIEIDLNSILGKSLNTSLEDLKGNVMTELTSQLYQTPEVQQHLQEQIRQQSVQASGSFLYQYKHLIIPAAIAGSFLAFYGFVQVFKK